MAEDETVREEKKGKGRSRRRRWLRRVVALVSLAPVVLYFGREFTVHPLLVELGPYRVAGYEIAFSDLDGSWFGGLGVVDLRVEASSEEHALRSFRSDRVEVAYSAWGALRGSEDWLESVAVGPSEARVDLTRAPAEPEEPEPDEPPGDPPARLPAVDIASVDLDLRIDDGRTVVLRGIEVASESGADWRLRVLGSTLVDASGPRSLEDIVARFSYDAGAVTIDEVTAAGERHVGPSSVDLTGLARQTVTWDVALAAFGATASLTGRREGDLVTGTLDLDGLDLARLRAALAPDAPDSLADLAGIVGAEAEVTLSLEAPENVELVVDANLRDVVVDGRGARSVEVEARATEGVATVARLAVDQGPNTLSLTDLVASLDAADLDEFLRGLEGDVVARVRDLGLVLGETDDTEAAAIPEHDVSIQARVSGGLATLNTGRVVTPGGSFEILRGELELAEPEDGSGRRIAIDLDADISDFAPLGEILRDPQPWAGTLKGDLFVEGELPRVEGRGDLTGSGVVVSGFELGEVELRAASDGKSLSFDELRATTDDFTLLLSGGWNFDSQSFEDVDLEGRVVRPESWIGFVAPGGAFAIEAHVDGPWSRPTGKLTVSGDELSVGGVELGHLDAEIHADDGELELRRLLVGTPYADVDTSMTASLPVDGRPLDLVLTKLELVRDDAGLALASPAEIAVGEDSIRVEGANFEGSAGSVDASFAWDSSRGDVSLDVVALEPTPFLASVLPVGLTLGRIDSTVTLVWEGDDLRATGSGSVVGFRPTTDESAFDLDFAGELRDRRAELRTLSLRFDGETVADFEASLPLDFTADPPLVDGDVRVAGRASLPVGRSLPLRIGGEEAVLAGEGAGTLDLAGSWRAVTGSIVIDGDGITLTGPEALRVCLPEPSSLHLEIAIGDGIDLRTLDLDVPGRAEVDLSGRIAVAPDVVAHLDARDRWRDAAVELDGTIDLEEIAWVRELAGLRRLEGRGAGSVEVRGTVGQPEVSGGLTLTGGELRIASTLPAIRAIDAAISFAGQQVTLERLSGELGAAPFGVTGSIDWGADDPLVDLAITGDGVLLLRTSDARVRADLDLHVAGGLSALEATGELALRDSRFRQDVDFLGMLQGSGGGGAPSNGGLQLFSLADAPLSDMRFDLSVKTFEPLDILSNVARGSLRVDLRLGGTGEVPLPKGRIFLDPTRVRLPSGTLTFSSGIIEFTEANPFEPTLDLRGETRLSGYDITVALTGPLSAPEVILSSTPSLPHEDLLLLVLTGQLPEGGLLGSGSQASQSITLYLAKDLLAKWRSGGLDEEESILDRLEIVTGRDVSKSGVLTTEATLRLREKVLGERDTLYVVAERDRYEDVNLGLRIVFRFE